MYVFGLLQLSPDFFHFFQDLLHLFLLAVSLILIFHHYLLSLFIELSHNLSNFTLTLNPFILQYQQSILDFLLMASLLFHPFFFLACKLLLLALQSFNFLIFGLADSLNIFPFHLHSFFEIEFQFFHFVTITLKESFFF